MQSSGARLLKWSQSFWVTDTVSIEAFAPLGWDLKVHIENRQKLQMHLCIKISNNSTSSLV